MVQKDDPKLASGERQMLNFGRAVNRVLRLLKARLGASAIPAGVGQTKFQRFMRSVGTNGQSTHDNQRQQRDCRPDPEGDRLEEQADVVSTRGRDKAG